MSRTTGARGNEHQDLRTRLAATESRVGTLPSRMGNNNLTRGTYRTVIQAAHGFIVGKIIRYDGDDDAWVTCLADSNDHAFIGGMVVSIPTPNTFVVAFPGSYITGLLDLGISPGIWYLSDTDDGDLVDADSAPALAVPVLMVDSDRSGILLGGAAAAAAPAFLQIIQGQTVASGQYGVTYASSLTLTQLYDPDVDTTYPSGLGNAWLWVDGVRQTDRVLVRHDAIDYQTFLLAGTRRRVLNQVTLTVASGPDAGQTMTAYRHTWE